MVYVINVHYQMFHCAFNQNIALIKYFDLMTSYHSQYMLPYLYYVKLPLLFQVKCFKILKTSQDRTYYIYSLMKPMIKLCIFLQRVKLDCGLLKSSASNCEASKNYSDVIVFA